VTGQMIVKNNLRREKSREKTKIFRNFLTGVANFLGDLGYTKIYKSFSKISESEIEWAASHLNYYYNYMIKYYAYDEILIFLLTKTTAILSLWGGYISAGGRSPPPFHNPPSFNTIYPLITEETSPNPNTVIVIPTRLTSEEMHLSEDIKKNLLSPLSKLNLIKKILLVGDIDSRSERFLQGIPKVSVIAVDKKEDSPAHSRNIGIKEALSLGADSVLFIDDDVKILDANVINYLASKAHNIRGIVAPLVKGTRNTWFDIFHDYDGTLNGVYYRDGLLLYATTCCTAISSEVLLDIQFDENFKLAAGEDIDFSIRALRKGFPIIPIDNIKIFHDYNYVRNPLEKFIRRYFRYGIGNYTLISKHPYYYLLLSKCKERRTVEQFKITNTTTVPPEIVDIKNKFKEVLR